jgi:hypothetical protein
VEASEPLADVYAAALAGDERGALAALSRVPSSALDAKGQATRACLLERFYGNEPLPHVDDPLLARVLDAYRAYWKRAMMDRAAAERESAALFENLTALLGGPSEGEATDTDAVRAKLGRALEARGFHSLRGVTKPFNDLMVWRTEATETYDVAIPDGVQRVTVVLLRDFQSLGWSAFATCDGRYTGGWAEKDKLYCVADQYDLSSERFKVSYLAHEAQHLADYARFPALEQPELEYRAKLVELIESRSTTSLLVVRFASQGGDDRAAPHNFANRAVSRDLARRLGASSFDAVVLGTIPADRVRTAAAVLLAASTRSLHCASCTRASTDASTECPSCTASDGSVDPAD